MAEFYSVEYTDLRIKAQRRSPGLSKQNKPNVPLRTYTQVAAGSTGDTIVLRKLEPGAVRVLPGKWILEVAGWNTSTTISIGWKAYQNRTGGQEVASANGLVSNLNIATDGRTLLGANAALQVLDKLFSSRHGVDIVAQINGAAPAANATLKLLMDENLGG